MGRIKRGAPPAKTLKRHTYRNALPELLRDFGGRCAYSMQHERHAGALEVDHFNPKLKKNYIQDYNNLFPASRHCNGKKSNHWPTKAELAAGCHFLNPCEVQDYGHQIFEDKTTHELVGTTPAAKWHIRMCGLNASNLVSERKLRSENLKRIANHAVGFTGPIDAVRDFVSGYRELVESLIPDIPPPP